MKVAIVHDWLVGGGAERVTQALHELYPDAPIYTSYCTPKWRKVLDGKVVTGFLQYWPFSTLRKLVGPLRIWWFSHLNLSGYNVVISVTGNGEAKGVRTPEGAIHVCYCHTPVHYYWRHYDEYLKHPGMGALDPLARFGLKLLVGPLRRWDRRASARPHHYIANSHHIKNDIKKYYDRDSLVIHPPVMIERFEHAEAGKRHGFLAGGRLVPMKRNDLAVQACTELSLPLTVYGDGPDRQRLEAMAGPTVKFTGFISDETVANLFATSEAFMLCSFEDFGVVGIEALAAGTPVIAYEAGGPLDYVQPGKTGLLFDKQNIESLKRALESFPSKTFDHKAIRLAAQDFSTEAFKKHIKTFIDTITS